MMRFIGFFTVALILTAAGLWFSGFRFHFEHLKYYLRLSPAGDSQQLRFADGQTLTGSVVQETEDTVRFNTDGAIMVFSMAEIEAIESVRSRNVLERLAQNYRNYHKKYPLITFREQKPLDQAWEDFAMEPSRIAEEIKAKNPGISVSGRMEEAMAMKAKADARRAQMEAEMRRAM